MDPAAPKISINLLEHDDTDDSVVNRLIGWAVTYGRYIMIGTEVIVLLAFISRFSLDRQLTDLREEISQKEIILTANQDFENQFRKIQEKNEITKTVLSTQTSISDILFLIQGLLPPDIRLTDFQIEKNELNFSAIAGSNEGFSQFLLLLSQQKQLLNVEISDVQKNNVKGIQFNVHAVVSNKNVIKS